MKNILNEYYEWICRLVNPDERPYTKLLTQLHNTVFNYILPMDENRYENGIDLRYRFAYEHYPRRYTNGEIDDAFGSRECSVLEMMAALALRCEEDFMSNPEIGDRTEEWFWRMIKNLGLDPMTDGNYNEEDVYVTIDIFLERAYQKNGRGGLFVVRDRTVDMRDLEIWSQLMAYLSEVIE